MTRHIPKGTRTKIPPPPPIPGRIYFEVRPIRGWSEKQFPIQGVRNDHHFPGSFLTLRPQGAIGPGMGFLHLAYFTVPDPLTQFPDSMTRISLVTHLSCHPGLLREPGEQSGFVYRMRQWFLTVNVCAQGQCPGSNQLMGSI